MDRQQYESALDEIEHTAHMYYAGGSANALDYDAQRVLHHTEMAAHILDMLPNMREFLAHGRINKLDRWLGFAQGFLVAGGMASLNECRQMNMPADAEFMAAQPTFPFDDPY